MAVDGLITVGGMAVDVLMHFNGMGDFQIEPTKYHICYPICYILYTCISIIQFICILESQVVECSMGSFYTQRF